MTYIKINMRRSPFMDKERIFDKHKNLKLKSKGSRCFYLNVSSFAPSESQSVALINRHKSSKSRRATNRSPRHHISICYCQATWPNDCYAKWQLSIYRAPFAFKIPIFHLPILRIYLQGLSCLPWVSQMIHRLWEKRRYHVQKTRLQLHQSCSRPFWHETFVHVAVYGSGISAEWKICGISALAYRQEREPLWCCCNDWLLHMSFQYSNRGGGSTVPPAITL